MNQPDKGSPYDVLLGVLADLLSLAPSKPDDNPQDHKAAHHGS